MGAHESNYFVTCIMLKIRSEMANNNIELESSSYSSDFIASEDSFLVPVMNMLVNQPPEYSQVELEKLQKLHE